MKKFTWPLLTVFVLSACIEQNSIEASCIEILKGKVIGTSCAGTMVKVISGYVGSRPLSEWNGNSKVFRAHDCSVDYSEELPDGQEEFYFIYLDNSTEDCEICSIGGVPPYAYRIALVPEPGPCVDQTSF